MTNESVLSLGDVVWIDAKDSHFGKVLDMRTHNGTIEYLIEHARRVQAVGAPSVHSAHEWIAAGRLQLAEDKQMP